MRSLIAHGMVCLMALWLFLRIDSMTSVFCFLMATSLMAATRLPLLARTAWMRHALVAVVLLFAASVLFFGLGEDVLSSMGRDSSLTGRTGLWTIISGMNPNSMLGAGFEAFWRGPRVQHLAQTVGFTNEAHSGYLEVYLNLGWIGLALLGLVFGRSASGPALAGVFRRCDCF
jgi:O-antigen ligase